VLIWLAIPVPNRIRTIFSFAISRPIGSPPATSPDYYLFYFKQLGLYFSDNWIAWISIGILIAALYFYRTDQKLIFAAGLFLLPLVLMTLNQNKQDRFLFTFIPAVWVVIAAAAARIPKTHFRFAAALTLCGAMALSFDSRLVTELMRRQFAPDWTRPVVNFIARRTDRANEIRLLGATNELNPATIQYHSAAESDFSIKQNFDWSIEENPKTALDIICINCESQGKLVRSRTFKRETVVRHYFLDTSDGAPYNPIQN
jgi:hypothetical protein